MDLRKKAEFLYHEVLGDIGELVEKIGQVNDQIPVLAEQINSAAERLESASTAIQERLGKLSVMEATKAVELVRQELAAERERQEVELQKFANVQIGKIGEAADKAVMPAADKLLGIMLDAIREREKLVKQQAEHPGWIEQMVRPFLYIAVGSAVAIFTTWVIKIM